MMSQNRSHAVMAQRVEVHDSLDLFPTPPWATRALTTHCLGYPGILKTETAWDPCCGNGDMVKPLREAFGGVAASDIHPYPFVQVGGFQYDFVGLPDPNLPKVDWLIFNPPFKLALEFILMALQLAPNVAVFARLQLLEGIERRELLWNAFPMTKLWVFSERVPIVKGMLDPEAGSATAYAWFTWQRGENPRAPGFIPPCRSELDRPADYDPYAKQIAEKRAEEARERTEKAAKMAAGKPVQSDLLGATQ